ncbi:HAMP domain-containing protein, partial [Nguyenibacter vanlangensis]|nr:HAMP domain-containing protein [Nguyenibacter vanlangensis]
MLSGALAILLSGLQSQHSLEKQIRRAVRAERTEVISAAGGMDLAHFRPVVQNLVRHEPDFFYLLEDGANRVLAGNMLHLRPQPGSRWLSRAHRQLYGEPESAIYGEGVLLNDGGYFFVGLNARSLTELRRDFWIIVGWSLVGFSVLGVGGGMILSAIILGRIETISMTARRIMSGDMAQRIPYQGADDEFDHLAHSLNAMLERNERLISSLQQVSNDIAHDMRRPLSRLRRRLEAAALAERLPDAA